MNYYNDFDKKSCVWLAELIKQKLIPDGTIDNRSIKDVEANDLLGFDQVHFFAGIGGWPLALQLAGVSEKEKLWTGSCPCQPFSSAGQRRGTEDERHLWPEFNRIIAQCKPPIVFGEQVASKDGRVWLSGVRSDLETLGYAVGASDLCAAGVGAPHIRQRLYWVADSGHVSEGFKKPRTDRVSWPGAQTEFGSIERYRSSNNCENSGVGNSECEGLERHPRDVKNKEGWPNENRPTSETSCDCWSEYSLTPCGDGAQRRIKPGLAPLANGVPGRVGLLRGYGNAIVPQVATEFIKAFFSIKGSY